MSAPPGTPPASERGGGAPNGSPKEGRAGVVLIMTGAVFLGAGFLLLWLGSVTAPPFLIILGYLLIGSGILW